MVTGLGAEMATASRHGQTGAMDPVVRRLRPEESSAFRRSVMVPFLAPFAGDPDQVADQELGAAKLEPDRAWVVDTGDGFAGNAGIYSLDVTLPGLPGRPCPVIPMAGVTAVGVHPTHRRRGYLGQLMAAMHDDARQRGEAIAGLEASESIIYGRFGYGLAANLAEYSIDSRFSAFAVPSPSLDLALVDKDEAGKVLPDIFDRQRRTRAGEVSRSAGYWTQVLADAPHHRAGAAARFHAVCDEGYVLYRATAEANTFQGDRVTILVEELRGTTPEVEAALWRFVLDLDLVGQVKAMRRPVDEPVRWRLADPRQLRTVSVEDRLYVRILDPAAAFEARQYQGEGRLVLDVRPPAASEGEADAAPGRWVLEAGPEGASCRRAHPGEDADLSLGLPALGSLYLGGFPASLLAAGGRVDELRAGSLLVADALLTTRPSPRSGTNF
jgi:predicted acetyltransferase